MTSLKSLEKKQCCFNCRYYIESLAQDGRRYDQEVSGLCRRYPPTPVAYSDEDLHVETVIWPMVNRFEYCGEFRTHD